MKYSAFKGKSQIGADRNDFDATEDLSNLKYTYYHNPIYETSKSI
jgi:hypothetical protein